MASQKQVFLTLLIILVILLHKSTTGFSEQTCKVEGSCTDQRECKANCEVAGYHIIDHNYACTHLGGGTNVCMCCTGSLKY